MKKILIVASLMLLVFSGANAAMTTAGTSVANTASLAYKAGTVDRTATSNTDTFVVDRKVDVLVTNTNSGNTIVEPGATQAVIAFSVTNEGNKAENYTLAIAQGTVDQFDPTTCKIFNGTTEILAPLNIAQETTINLEARCDIPAGVVNADLGNIVLTASSASTSTVGADTQGTEDVVFADDAGLTDAVKDGKHSAGGTYEVRTAVMTVAKSSCVVNDPVNGTINPKRIPGATVRYLVQVTNAGAGSATSAVVTDNLSGELTYVSGLIAASTCPAVSATCGALGTTNGDTVAATGQAVTATFGTVAANSSECAYIDVTIK
jgi:uncharacterized repeat protein (TIGR01451 family)